MINNSNNSLNGTNGLQQLKEAHENTNNNAAYQSATTNTHNGQTFHEENQLSYAATNSSNSGNIERNSKLSVESASSDQQ